MTAAAQQAFAVCFKDVARWDPTSFRGIEWHWPAAVMTQIGAVLCLRREPVDRDKHVFADLQPITVHFDGSIDKRVVERGREYSMDLFFAQPGDIVVAKIDLKNGAVGIVPNWSRVVVTGHFAVYRPDRTKIVPEFLERMIQAPFFKAYLWRNKVGAEGRKEVKLDFFETVAIPLPPLCTQHAIVAQWRGARHAIVAAEERARNLEAEIEAEFLADLGFRLPSPGAPPKFLAVEWSEFVRWSASYNQTALTGMDLARGRYPAVALGDLLDLVQYGTSQRANNRSQGVPVIRMNNIVSGILDLTNLKHVELREGEYRKLTLRDGDILINRTNSKELVGKCAVIHATADCVFASYLIRVRVQTQKASPDYISYALNTAIGREQIDAVSRQIIGQANINSRELRSLQLPLPPLSVQRRIMAKVADGRARIAREREAARRMRMQIERDMEAYLLGTKKVPAS